MANLGCQLDTIIIKMHPQFGELLSSDMSAGHFLIVFILWAGSTMPKQKERIQLRVNLGASQETASLCDSCHELLPTPAPLEDGLEPIS